MTYQGRVQNGQVVLDDPASLPEGALVRVELVTALPEDSKPPRKGGIWKGRVHIESDFDELPDDLAVAFGVKDP